MSIVRSLGMALVETTLDEDPCTGITPVRGPARDRLVLGSSPVMRGLADAIARAASSRGWVSVHGEYGTGKSMVARAIHDAGPHRGAAFVLVDGLKFSAQMLDDVDPDGTLVLRDVTELSAAAQRDLSRVLSYRALQFPSRGPIRIIATSQRHLDVEVESGNLREDLRACFQECDIRVPALRERIRDLDRLCACLLGRAEREVGRRIDRLTPGGLDVLGRHRWPGNVDELYEVLRRAARLSQDGEVTASAIALAGLEGAGRRERARQRARLADVEREHIAAVLVQTGWHKKRSAEVLGISRPTLDRKIVAYGLKRPE